MTYLSSFWREPDILFFQSSGLDCYAQRNHMKAWCGYVRIPEDHILYGKDYSSRWVCDKGTIEIKETSGIIPIFIEALRDDDDGAASLDCIISVHGGLTYSGDLSFAELAPKGYWLGFDCSHAGDINPYDIFSNFPRSGTYRDMQYVRTELESLARQISEFSLTPVKEQE